MTAIYTVCTRERNAARLSSHHKADALSPRESIWSAELVHTGCVLCCVPGFSRKQGGVRFFDAGVKILTHRCKIDFT